MKPEELSDAIGGVDDSYIESADKLRRGEGAADSKPRERTTTFAGYILRRVAFAACVCLVVGLLTFAIGRGSNDPANITLGGSEMSSGSTTGSSSGGADSTDTQLSGGDYAIRLVSYPEVIPFPDESDYVVAGGDIDYETYFRRYEDWSDERGERLRLAQEYRGSLNGFYADTMSLMLTGEDDGNRVYSPVNVYLALCMLAETTDGESRQQILDLLGLDDIDQVRLVAKSLWNANYSDDGATTSILANSVWLDEDIGYNSAALDVLAEEYYASSFSGQMGSAEYTDRLHKWLNDETRGLLEDSVQSLEFDPATVFALASTVYYNARWSTAFQESKTTEGIFHTPKGDVAADFMHQTSHGSYYWGEGFSAACRYFDNSGGSMWFILPDEGVSVDELLTDGECMDFILSAGDWENSKYVTINMAVPRFDVASDTDLTGILRALGVTDVFDPVAADFSPIIPIDDGGFLSVARHAARVMIDEEGVEAAAYTVLMRDGGTAPPADEVDFVLDRPFIFVLRGIDGEILFVGVVNYP